MPAPLPTRQVHLPLAVALSVGALAYHPLAQAAQTKRGLLLLLAAATLALALAWRRGAARGLRLSIGGCCWLLYGCWSGLSLGWLRAGSGMEALADLAWVGALLLALGGALERRQLRATARAVALCVGGASALVALAQWTLGGHGLALHGGHGNPNWLGLVLVAALPLSLDAARVLDRNAGWRTRGAILGLVGLQVVGLWLAASRVAWAAGAALILGVVVQRARRSGRPLALAGALVLAGSLLGGGAVLLANRAEGGAGHALAGRLQIWRHTAEAALDAQPAGVGLGGFGHAFMERQGRALATVALGEAVRRFENARYAHNDWLQAALETGLPGLLLLLGALVIAPLLGRSRWPAGAMTLLAVALCALGDGPLRQPAVLVLLALALLDAPRIRIGPRPTLLLQLAALAALALLLAATAGQWLSTRQRVLARDALPAQRLARLHGAARLCPGCGEAALELGLALLDRGQPAPALAELQRARALLANTGTHVALGNAHLLLGDPARAAAAFARALSWHPASFRARASMAEAQRRLGDLDRAADHLQAARRLLPGHPRLPALERRLQRDRLRRDIQSHD